MTAVKNHETFGTRLAKARGRKGLTQEQLGELLNVSKAQISYYESDKNRPSHDKLIQLCSALDVSATWLLSGVEEAGGKVIDPESYALILKLEGLPDVLRQFVMEAVRLAEQTKDAIPKKFLLPPDSENWAEFHQYLTKLSDLIERRNPDGADENSTPNNT